MIIKKLILLLFIPCVAYANPSQMKNEVEISPTELKCMALNVYHESRGEPYAGQKAVALVTMNRVNDPRFPDDICSVVWQDSQFSWTRTKGKKTPANNAAWNNAKIVAEEVVIHYDNINDITNGAVMFHSTSAKPKWRRSFKKTITINKHIFYR